MKSWELIYPVSSDKASRVVRKVLGLDDWPFESANFNEESDTSIGEGFRSGGGM